MAKKEGKEGRRNVRVDRTLRARDAERGVFGAVDGVLRGSDGKSVGRGTGNGAVEA